MVPPLLFKGVKLGRVSCVQKPLGTVIGMLWMENNWSEQRQSHLDKAQVCASKIITQLETASHPGVTAKLLQCTGVCAGDQRKTVIKRRQGTSLLAVLLVAKSWRSPDRDTKMPNRVRDNTCS